MKGRGFGDWSVMMKTGFGMCNVTIQEEFVALTATYSWTPHLLFWVAAGLSFFRVAQVKRHRISECGNTKDDQLCAWNCGQKTVSAYHGSNPKICCWTAGAKEADKLKRIPFWAWLSKRALGSADRYSEVPTELDDLSELVAAQPKSEQCMVWWLVRIVSLLWTDNVVLLVLSEHDLLHALPQDSRLPLLGGRKILFQVS